MRLSNAYSNQAIAISTVWQVINVALESRFGISGPLFEIIQQVYKIFVDVGL